MQLSLVLLAKKTKTKNILVMVQSMVSGHCMNRIRERLGDKLEFIGFDPHVQANVLYREKKKLRSLKDYKGGL
ncbi:39S ribosomal protein L33, mitochondrial [Aphidius gifuensis]|uniref:39S ribosomal protein L33, mitochondrial n=1 Tax=Aphidius gifuensis TaxID=684658 RepID=UPI001CDD2D40|nr:39S ribosomal protein L33, mitochondrial [Aphidius gifuensis]